jgi:hypothetical protein
MPEVSAAKTTAAKGCQYINAITKRAADSKARMARSFNLLSMRDSQSSCGFSWHVRSRLWLSPGRRQFRQHRQRQKHVLIASGTPDARAGSGWSATRPSTAALSLPKPSSAMAAAWAGRSGYADTTKGGDDAFHGA